VLIIDGLMDLKNPEDGDRTFHGTSVESTFSQTSVRASATRYQVHEDIFKIIFA
jgi:hypothetical protein